MTDNDEFISIVRVQDLSTCMKIVIEGKSTKDIYILGHPCKPRELKVYTLCYN